MIKFNLIKKLLNKKFPSLCFGFSVFVFFLFIPSSSFAFWTELKNVLLLGPFLTIALILGFFIALTQALALLAGFILDGIMSPGFISLGYTNPATNQIIKLGLSITQSFVNLLLVWALVYTALSIALRIGETEAKKILVKLIIVALLVNFAPVICGLIVDGANIVMYYFLEKMEEGVSGILTQIGPFGELVIKNILDLKANLTEKTGILMNGVAIIMVNVSMAIAFLLYAGIFLFRYVAIWLLVILAPLAFVFWALPLTKKLWDMWLNNFIQWAIIGIPMAFFLYLAMSSFQLMSAAFKDKITMPGIEAASSGIFNEIFPYFVIIVFLFLGFAIGLQTSAMGASTAMAWTKKAGGGVGTMARRWTGRVLPRGAKQWMEKQAAAPFPGFRGKGVGQKILTATGISHGIYALRRGLGEAGIRLTEAERKDIREAEEKHKGKMPEAKVAGLRSPVPLKNKVGILNSVIEEGQIDDIRKLGFSDQEIIKIGQHALNTHPDEFKKIRDAFPHLAEQMGWGASDSVKKAAGVMDFEDDFSRLVKKNHSLDTQIARLPEGKKKEALKKEKIKIEDEMKEIEKDIEDFGTVEAKIVAKMKTANIPKMDLVTIFKLPPTDTKRINIETAIHKHWTGEKVGTAARNFDRVFIEPFMEMVKAKEKGWYERENPRLATYLDSSAAKGLGLGF